MLQQMLRRITNDKSEGDIAYFLALSFGLEYLTKLTTAAVVACLQEDSARTRYGIEYGLVRANAVGDWSQALNRAVAGPASTALPREAHHITRQLTERVGKEDWRFQAIQNLRDAARILDLKTAQTTKPPLRELFGIGVNVRNRTRAHGAPTGAKCSLLCPLLEESWDLLITNLELFTEVSWVNVRRQTSRKYKITPLLGDPSPFLPLQHSDAANLLDGIHINVGRYRRIPLVWYDEDLDEISLPNGNFSNGMFQTLSYTTDRVRSEDGTPWMVPPTKLPPSQTEGAEELEIRGNLLTNLPRKSVGHVNRTALEARIAHELRTIDRHPIVSLTGSGGIGKTTAAIAAIEQIAVDDPASYDMVLWVSARDIDLLDVGPKPVTPKALSLGAIAGVAARLVAESSAPADHLAILQDLLSGTSYGQTLMVLDNFETVEAPGDVFSWIDAFIRPPNKVLITTRIRDFAGDLPIEIGGMTVDEANALIDVQGKRLGILELLTSSYRNTLIMESEGHPYVIKILLGQVAHERRAGTPRRIIASADNLLRALFERTFLLLSPDAQRVFLLLSSWPVFVPEVAVEAIALRPGVERSDVGRALDDLQRYSLVERIETADAGEYLVGVPLAAATFGKRKLEVSFAKTTVREDRELLMEFGPGSRKEGARGVMPRVKRLLGEARKRTREDRKHLEQYLPIVEYIAHRLPAVFVELADLVLEGGQSEPARRQAREYLGRFLETAPKEARPDVWLKIAELCHSDGELRGEIHALCEAGIEAAEVRMMGHCAGRINQALRTSKEVSREWSRPLELAEMLSPLIRKFEERLAELTATDCSRLAWLYLNSDAGKQDRAMQIAEIGLARDRRNVHCANLLERLKSRG